MVSNYLAYDFEKNRDRIDKILDTPDISYDGLRTIPKREDLNLDNGSYVCCYVIFVCIRNLSELTKRYDHSTLAKIYRAFCSETVSLINNEKNCKEINIYSDGVCGIFDVDDGNAIFRLAYNISTVIKMINSKLEIKNIDPIDIGIGLDFGVEFVINPGDSCGVLNEIVWLGDVVKNASKISRNGVKTLTNEEIMVTLDFQHTLNEENSDMLFATKEDGCYYGSIYRMGNCKWLLEN
jgi:hypothetical protein